MSHTKNNETKVCSICLMKCKKMVLKELSTYWTNFNCAHSTVPYISKCHGISIILINIISFWSLLISCLIFKSLHAKKSANFTTSIIIRMHDQEIYIMYIVNICSCNYIFDNITHLEIWKHNVKLKCLRPKEILELRLRWAKISKLTLSFTF